MHPSFAEAYNSLAMEMTDGPFLHFYTHIVPIIAVTGYLFMLSALPRAMKSVGLGNSLNVKFFMASWNLFLSIGSLIMLVGLGIPFAQFLFKKGLKEGLCDEEDQLLRKYMMVFWIHIFAWSKYAELLDTVFLILKHPSKKVPFLHWYHHTTVLL